MWTFLIWTVAICSVASLIKAAIENDRDTRIAKVEAELRLKLVEKLGDPNLVARVIEARLTRPMDGSEDEASLEPALKQAPEAPAEQHSTSGWLFLGGLICFLVGGAFILAYFVEHSGEFLLPGLICSAVGLALLTYATSQRQIVKHLRTES